MVGSICPLARLNGSVSKWDTLLQEAYRLIDHVNKDYEIISFWTFGGGTAMMLQIGHRESHDVDIFLSDPQQLPYLFAAVEHHNFAVGPPDYSSDGIGHLKISFKDIGEIDFIVAGYLTPQYATKKTILGREILLETISEIVAKKIRFRGANIQPRDIFDIAAACHAGFTNDIKLALREIPEYRAIALAKIKSINLEYVDKVISQLIIRPKYNDVAHGALEVAKRVLEEN